MKFTIVPVIVGSALVQASIYDVPGGYRAVMFDRFSGVKDKVRLLLLSCYMRAHAPLKSAPEGTHFLVPWLQRAILYDCRTKPRVRLVSIIL
jgi:prohibitin 1